MRKFLINVNGTSYEVEVEEVENGDKERIPQGSGGSITRPLMEEGQESKSQGQVIEAPMPGSILKILMSKGQEVKAGDLIMVLEAMKMENEILAPRDGRLVDLLVGEGQLVESEDQLAIIG